MNKKVKLMSAVLAVVMMLSVFGTLGFTASADTTTTVNGKTCAVGDSIVYTVQLKTPEALEDFQGTVEYQSAGLELTDYSMPNTTGDNVYYNTQCQDEIPYNGSDIVNFYDFTTQKVLLQATFKVKAQGTYTIKNVMRVISGASQTTYMNKGQVLNNNFTITETTTVSTTTKAVKVSKVALKQGTKVVTGKSITLKKGASIKLTAVCTPSNATNKKVKWTSSSAKVAKVTSAGKVTAVAKGSATITAKAQDGSNKSAKCIVKVTQPVTKVTIKQGSKTVKTLSLKRNKTVTLKAVCTPSNANKKTVKWTSSKKNIATVSAKGVVKVKKNAPYNKSTVITAKATDGSNKSAKCTIKVKK